MGVGELLDSMQAEGVGPLRVEGAPVAKRHGREAGQGVNTSGGGVESQLK